jgi:hypothetical protein
LTPSEQRDYRQNALQPAFDYLGTQEVAMILHGTCYPESEKDIGVGSPYGKVASKLLPFEMLHGFNSNQLGPVGVIRDAQSISPYKSTVSTRNYLFLDLNELTSDKYARILSQKDIDSVFENPVQTGENYSYSKFPDAFSNYEYCIKIAHKNFKDKLSSKDIDALRLNNEFDDFKAKKASIVYKEALFDVLTKTYGTNNFNKWSELDANLISRIEAKDPEAIARYKKVIHRSKEDFDIYVFGQFLMDKQIKENTLYRKSIGFKYISDLLVGFSMADEWANQDLFLKNYRMGCPYGGKNNGPQIWDIPVLDPNKLFIDDDIVTDLKRSFMYIYPYAKVKNVALKTSVTGLMQNEDYTETNIEPKALTVGEVVQNDTALKVGNAYHLIMEHIDYFADNNIDEIYSKLVSLKLIEKEIEKHINLNSIKNAVETVKGLIQPNTKIFKEQQFIIKDKHCNLIDGSSDETKVMVQGVIDLMLVTDRKAIIIDFKSNRTNDVEDLKNKYKLQLKLYRYALSHGKNVNVEETYLYSFFLNKLIKVD